MYTTNKIYIIYNIDYKYLSLVVRQHYWSATCTRSDVHVHNIVQSWYISDHWYLLAVA